jgi:hypothetical protein
MDDVAQPEYPVLAIVETGMGSNPLNPRLELFIVGFGYGLRDAMPIDKPRQSGQPPLGNIALHIRKIDFVELK